MNFDKSFLMINGMYYIQYIQHIYPIIFQTKTVIVVISYNGPGLSSREVILALTLYNMCTIPRHNEVEPTH
jgi:hypothetical protein